MRLFDTLSREIRELKPREGDTYRFYCCGPTVYGPAHIGNFRTFVLQDVFRRTLEICGLKTFHVRNLTDVDDKTIRDSQAAGKTLTDFTEYWTKKFHEDCDSLNNLPPHKEPSAVGHIPQQVAMIEELVDKGHAYRSDDGSVYFSVSSFPTYGKLSRLDQRELKTGASGAITDDEYEKDSVADFALWKGRREEDGENYWESPWGQGRPGWHLECSAMCREYLGESFDLHSGGVDLVFPHHENEIAQSEACTGASMADHWFHTTHLLVDGGKMSKSAKNFYTLGDIEKAGFTASELRYVLISAHYRQPLNFVARDAEGNESFPALQGARQALQRIAKFEKSLKDAAGETPEFSYEDAISLTDRGSFEDAIEALADDLNTPEAFGRIFSAMKAIKPGDLKPEDALKEWKGLHTALEAMGIELPAEEEKSEAPPEIAEKAEQRWKAKQDKDWATADRLRDEVLEAGWEIKDTKEGYELCSKN